jgi:hypothetical protein
MALWKRLWLLFAVIWVVVAGLNAVSILAFSEGAQREKAALPIFFGIAVPAVAYGLGWLWEYWRKKGDSSGGSSPP